MFIKREFEIKKFCAGAAQKNHLPPNSPRPIFKKIINNTLSLHTHAEAHLAHNSLPEQIALYETAHLPRKLARCTSPKAQKTLLSTWRKARSYIEAVGAVGVREARSYSFNASAFYDEARRQKTHPSYFLKALALINDYGKFLASREGGYVYEDVPAPNGYESQQMLQAIEEAGRPLGRTMKPITLELLEANKAAMPVRFYNFMFAMLWLGLRPSELSRALQKGADSWSIEVLDGHQVLCLRQNKLQQLGKEDRMKLIPIVEPEQKVALQLLTSGSAETIARPLVKTVHAYLGKEVGLYSSRKAFAKLMLSRGWRFEDASKMLGHQSLKTTENYYIDKRSLATARAKEALKYRLTKS